jgi:hypothetical protein
VPDSGAELGEMDNEQATKNIVPTSQERDPSSMSRLRYIGHAGPAARSTAVSRTPDRGSCRTDVEQDLVVVREVGLGVEMVPVIHVAVEQRLVGSAVATTVK